MSVWRVSGFLFLALAWQMGVFARNSPAMPGLDVVGMGLVTYVTHAAVTDTLASLRLMAGGFAAAVIFAIPLGVAIALVLPIERVALMPAEALRNVSGLTLFPVLIVLFGLADVGKMSVIFWTAWPPILLSTVHAVRMVDQQIVEAARMDGAGRWCMLRDVQLPLASPTISNGLRIGLGGGWISLVAAEMLGAQSGLGFRVMLASQSFHYGEMYAAIVTIATVSFVLNRAMAWVQDRLEKETTGDDAPVRHVRRVVVAGDHSVLDHKPAVSVVSATR